MHFNSKIIILRKIKYGESDLIIHGLTSSGQKLSLIARGALKSKKRFGGGVLEPTHYLQIEYKKSQNENGLSVLEEAQIIRDFHLIRTDYDKIQLALKFLEIISKVAQEGDENSQGIFNLLGHSLSSLENVKNLQLMEMQFFLKLLHQQGVLVLEDWMKPFLQFKIDQSDQIQTDLNEFPLRLKYIQYQLEQYLKTAENH